MSVIGKIAKIQKLSWKLHIILRTLRLSTCKINSILSISLLFPWPKSYQLFFIMQSFFSKKKFSFFLISKKLRSERSYKKLLTWKLHVISNRYYSNIQKQKLMLLNERWKFTLPVDSLRKFLITFAEGIRWNCIKYIYITTSPNFRNHF